MRKRRKTGILALVCCMLVSMVSMQASASEIIAGTTAIGTSSRRLGNEEGVDKLADGVVNSTGYYPGPQVYSPGPGQTIVAEEFPWVGLNLGGVYDVESVMIAPGALIPEGMMKLEASMDGINWNHVMVIPALTAEWALNEIAIEGGVTAAFLRLKETARHSTNAIFLSEIQAKGTLNALSSAYPSIISTAAYSAVSSEYPGILYDGNGVMDLCDNAYTTDCHLYDTFWTSDDAGQGTGDWISYDLGDVYGLDNAVMYYRTGVDINNNAIVGQTASSGYDIDIYSSEDNVSWNYEKTITLNTPYNSETGRLNGRCQKLDLSGIETQYIKFEKSSVAGSGSDMWAVSGIQFFSAVEGIFENIDGFTKDGNAVSNICAGNISVNRTVKAEGETNAVIVTGLYKKADATAAVLQPEDVTLSSSPTPVNSTIYVDPQLTGLSEATEQGQNLATGATGKFISNNDGRDLPAIGSEGGEGAGSVPENAVDGILETWASAANEWAYTVHFELAQECTVGTVRLYFMPGSYPIDFDIMLSEDGEGFTTVRSVKNNNQAGWHDFYIKPQNAKYIRIRDNVAQTNVRQMAIGEMEIYSTSRLSDYEIRSFLVNADTWEPFSGQMAVLSDGVQSEGLKPEATENIIGINSAGKLSFNPDGSGEGVLVIRVYRDEELIYANMLDAQEYEEGFATVINQFIKEETIKVILTGAYSGEFDFTNDKVFRFAEFEEKYVTSNDEEKIALIKENMADIAIDETEKWQKLSETEKTAVYGAVLNGDITSFDDIKAVMDAAIIEETENNKTGNNVTKPGNTSSGVGGKTGGSTSISVVVPVETVKQETEKTYVKYFDDLSNYIWAEEAIEALATKGVINGIADRVFAPAENVTRAQMVKILVSYFGTEMTKGEIPFDDVDKNGWAYPYITAAYNSGLVSGTSAKTFSPDEFVSKQDAAVLIYRFCKNAGITIPEKYAYDGFDDENEIGEYAKEAITVMTKGGVIGGDSSGKFLPKKPCTRAEAAKLVYTAGGNK